jgi:hypothetical protein
MLTTRRNTSHSHHYTRIHRRQRSHLHHCDDHDQHDDDDHHHTALQLQPVRHSSVATVRPTTTTDRVVTARADSRPSHARRADVQTCVIVQWIPHKSIAVVDQDDFKSRAVLTYVVDDSVAQCVTSRVPTSSAPTPTHPCGPLLASDVRPP